MKTRRSIAIATIGFICLICAWLFYSIGRIPNITSVDNQSNPSNSPGKMVVDARVVRGDLKKLSIHPDAQDGRSGYYYAKAINEAISKQPRPFTHHALSNGPEYFVICQQNDGTFAMYSIYNNQTILFRDCDMSVWDVDLSNIIK